MGGFFADAKVIRVDFSMLLLENSWSCRVFCRVAYWWGQYVGQIATIKVMLVLMSITKMNRLGPNIKKR